MPNLTTRKVITGVLVVFSVCIAFILLYQFRSELILIFTGIVISISIAPAVDWLRKFRLSRAFSVILIYASLIVIFSGFIIVVVPQMIQQAGALFPRVEGIYSVFKSTLQNSPYPYIREWVSHLPNSLDPTINVGSGTSGTGALNSVNLTLSVAQNIIGGFFTFSIVFLIGFYWTLEGERVEHTFLLFFPDTKRESTREIIREIETRVGGFMRGQGLLALAVGCMAFIAYLLIGLPSVFPIAFWAAMSELIPVFGPTLGAIPAVLVAFASFPSKILWVILATVLIQLFENHFLNPKVMQKTVGVNPIVTILSIVGFGSLFGFPGLLMAIPLAAIYQVILDRFLIRPAVVDVKSPVGRTRMSKLSYEVQEFVQDIRKRIQRKETGGVGENSDEIEDAIESIANDLDGLLAQSIQSDNLL